MDAYIHVHSQLAALPAIKETFSDLTGRWRTKGATTCVMWPRLLYIQIPQSFPDSNWRHPPAKQPIIHMKCKIFFKFRTSKIASAVYSGTIQQTLIGQFPVWWTCSTTHVQADSNCQELTSPDALVCFTSCRHDFQPEGHCSMKNYGPFSATFTVLHKATEMSISPEGTASQHLLVHQFFTH